MGCRGGSSPYSDAGYGTSASSSPDYNLSELVRAMNLKVLWVVFFLDFRTNIKCPLCTEAPFTGYLFRLYVRMYVNMSIPYAIRPICQ